MPHRRLIEAAQIDVTNADLRAQLALEAGRMGSWTWNVAEDVIDGDSVTAQLFGLGPEAKKWPRKAIFSDIHPADIPKVQKAMAAAMSHENIYEAEFRRVIQSETDEQSKIRWVGVRAQVVQRDDDGKALRFIGVSWDITEEKQRDEAILQIAADMDHRAKNAFAVIRAMINVGHREASDFDNFVETLRGQVEAMASAHALAADTSRTTQTPHAPVPILELIKNSLHPWILKNPDQRDQISVNGTPVPTVKSEAANSLSMIIQELASKSAKHGTLGPLGGSLDVKISSPNSSENLISWSESFDTSTKATLCDTPSGFGSTLLTHSVATLRGEFTRKLSPNGFTAELRIPN